MYVLNFFSKKQKKIYKNYKGKRAAEKQKNRCKNFFRKKSNFFKKTLD